VEAGLQRGKGVGLNGFSTGEAALLKAEKLRRMKVETSGFRCAGWKMTDPRSRREKGRRSIERIRKVGNLLPTLWKGRVTELRRNGSNRREGAGMVFGTGLYEKGLPGR